MPEITIKLREREYNALLAMTPVSSTPEKAAGDLLRWSFQGGLDTLIDSLLESWVSLLSIRDLETMEHTRRVTDYTVRLAARMGFSGLDLIHIRRGALLHDIGKLGIPDQVLWKNGILNEEEHILIKKHPDLAVQVLEPLEFLHPSLDIPHYHHERYDGSGYPFGLKGDSIPLAARVFAVVDVWDALCHERPYSQKTWSLEEIRAHFRAESNHLYDPRVVEQFLFLLEEPNITVQEAAMATSDPMPVSPQMQRPRSILELLAEELSIPASNEEQARIRLDQLARSFPTRTREVVAYLMGNTGAEVFLERRGGGSSLWYILWWLRNHARDHYELAAKTAIHSALDSKWSLQKGYENLSLIKEVAPYLPPVPEKKKGDFEAGGVHFFCENLLTIAVNCQRNDLWTYSVQQGAQVYIWSTDKFVEIKVDGRSTGLGFPDLPVGWVVLRHNRDRLPTYCRLPRPATEEEMNKLIDYIWKKADRRKSIPIG
jgi:hypothetical protein